MVVTVITPTIRMDGALEVARSVQAAREAAPEVDLRHLIAYWPGEPNWTRERVAPWADTLIASCAPGWVLFVDDDTRMHPGLLPALIRAVEEHPDAWAVLFAMDYPQFGGGVLWPKLPPRGGHVDGGQVALWRDYAVQEPWGLGGYGDGIYLAKLYARAPERWVTVPEVVTYHNIQRRRA